MSMLSASIVICTKDRQADLQRCLDSIRAQTRLPDEVIVVDAGSDEAARGVSEFSEAAPRVTVRHVPSEPGLTRQRNTGIQMATGDTLHFLDDDVVLDATYVGEVQRVFENEPDVLGAGPRVRSPHAPSKRWRALARLFLLPQVDGDGRMLPSGFFAHTHYAGLEHAHDVQALSGCAMAYRRAVFEELAFDEHFEGYGFMEDLDFSYRVGKRGRLVCVPTTQVMHIESPAARTSPRRLAAMEIANHYYVFTKHMPSDVGHWACFWWSDLGHVLVMCCRALRGRTFVWLLGALDGHWAILRGRAGASASMRHAPGEDSC